jgi:hypothetical protein
VLAKFDLAALLAHDPDALGGLDNPQAVALLLNRLQRAGAHEQAATLARRAAAYAPLDNPDHEASASEANKRKG